MRERRCEALRTEEACASAGARPSALKKLKLGHLADTLPERLVLANKQGLSFDSLLLLRARY